MHQEAVFQLQYGKINLFVRLIGRFAGASTVALTFGLSLN